MFTRGPAGSARRDRSPRPHWQPRSARPPGEPFAVTIINLRPGDADKILTGGAANESGEFEVSSALYGAASDKGGHEGRAECPVCGREVQQSPRLT